MIGIRGKDERSSINPSKLDVPGIERSSRNDLDPGLGANGLASRVDAARLEHYYIAKREV